MIKYDYIQFHDNVFTEFHGALKQVNIPTLPCARALCRGFHGETPWRRDGSVPHGPEKRGWGLVMSDVTYIWNKPCSLVFL